MNNLNENPSSNATVTETPVQSAPTAESTPAAHSNETTDNIAVTNGSKKKTLKDKISFSSMPPYLGTVSEFLGKIRFPLLIVLGALSLIVTASLLFSPFCHYNLLSGGIPLNETLQVSPVQIMQGTSSNTVSAVVLIFILVFLFASLLHYILSFRYFANRTKFARFMQRAALLSCAASGLYYIAGLLYAIIRNESEKRAALYYAGSLTPYILSTILLIAVSLVARIYFSPMEDTVTQGALSDSASKKKRRALALRLELAIYALATLAIAFIGALSDILNVTFTQPAGFNGIVLNGWEILTKEEGLVESFQMPAFFITSLVIVVIALVTTILISLLSNSKTFYKITLRAMIAGASLALALGLFGKYYEIAQAINEEGILEWISGYYPISGDLFVYEISSSSIYYFFAALAVVSIALARRPYSKGLSLESAMDAERLAAIQGKTAETQTAVSAQPSPAPVAEERRESVAPVPPVAPEAKAAFAADRGSEGVSVSTDAVNVSAQITSIAAKEGESAETEKRPVPMADPCPSFTELDEKAADLRAEIAGFRATPDAPMTLPTLVQHVVNYARNSRLHLSYAAEDIATFIAGLGATRLTILQGMSGTGKTSLPKIFTEALCGVCDIIEVESSWRDKNELLGYYNEFSRTYTPKKFTQALYKAALNPERLTFIVLDEMNLSRIEYYFSDFLSLMENEEDKREIKLLNVGLFRSENGVRYPYLALTDGHTIKIPRNVWFIGTANRDESTFEISDKVYDRAHTMNFNKRAPKATATGSPLPCRFVSSEHLSALLKEAAAYSVIDCDNDPTIKAVEELLAPYNISFGNRIANQIEAFVSIYCACFAPSDQVKQEALERILLSKVVCKLEFKSVENKELLAAEFKRRGLARCAEFVMKLSEG